MLDYIKTVLNGIKVWVEHKIVNPDWNVNNENDPAYVKNRTHYEAVENVKLAEFTTTEYYNKVGPVTAYMQAEGLTPSATYIFGDEYTIIYDGVEYRLPCVQQYTNWDSTYAIGFGLIPDGNYGNGNPQFSGDVPFALLQRYEDGKSSVEYAVGEKTEAQFYIWVPYDKQSPPHTFEIRHEEVTLKQLDVKYIPSEVIDKLNNALEKSELDTAIDQALADAKESGEFKGEKGDTGAPGKDGVDGYTPVRGADYWTNADKQEINDTNQAYIAAELAKRGQLKPEFANSIDDCTDTSKLYVLPDGYIYAYKKSAGATYTNIIDTVGYSDGKYVSGTTLGNDASTVATGVFPYDCSLDVPPTIYIKGVDWTTSNTHCRVVGYTNATGTTINVIQLTSADIVAAWTVTKLAEKYYKIAPTLNSSGKWAQHDKSTSTKNTKYLRMSFVGTGADLVLTLDEPIEDSVAYRWASTGHAFVPADYEERIVDMESHITTLGAKIDELAVDANSAPLYITQEAKRVADLVQSKRTAGSVTFTAMSDSHVEVDTTLTYGVANNMLSCRDAGLGLVELRKLLNLDFAAMLGDYTFADSSESVAQIKKDITYNRKCAAEALKGIPNIWCTGNHDINYGANSDRRMTEDELYAYITSNNVGTVQDAEHIGRNYGYVDLENQKLRCIYLNTVDSLDYPDLSGSADNASSVTAIQIQWLVDTALNFADKAYPTEWGVVLLSHHCLSVFQSVTKTLTAYKDGTSGSVSITTNGVTTAVNYDFTTANRGEIICAIHGHNHNFAYRKISDESYNKVTTEKAWLWSIGIPNIDTTRENEAATSSDTGWANAFGEFDSAGNPVYYKKIQGTTKSTSFCIITIDRKNRKVHALHYGAGIDREISY